MSILEEVYAILWNLADYIARLLRDFTIWLSTNLTGVLNWIQTAWAAALKAINDMLLFVKGVLQTLVDDLMAFLNNMVTAITQAFQTAWSIIRDAVLTVLNAISSFTTNLLASIKAAVQTLISEVKVIFSLFVDKVEQLIGTIVNFVFEVIADIKATVQGVITSIVTFAQSVFTTFQTVVSQALEALVSGPAAVFNALSQRFNDLGTALRDTIATVVAKLSHLDETLLKAITDAVELILGKFLDWTNAPEMLSMMDALTAVTTAQATQADYQGLIAGIFRRFSPQSSLARGVVFILLTAAAALPALLQVGSVYAQPITQALAREIPYQLLAAPDVVNAWKRDLIGRNAAVDILKRQGFSETDADTMFAVAETIPAELDALAFWHRELISDNDLATVFKDRGFTQTWASVYREASFLIPPPQDLIVMAVREVFSPETAARFGQFEDFPEAFAEWGAKQGLSKDWCLRYWAAHWGLPSATQGFEMFQRSIIEREDLVLLLKSLDVMPFWRDRLIQLAYNPFTRVDIRRMHQLGVLNDSQVLRAHLDLGYDPEKAQLLTEFVLRLNQNAPGENDEELGRLSRATILGFYEDGILRRDRAGELLVTLGITPEAAGLYLGAVDADQQRQERKAETDLVVSQAEAGVITFAQATDRLNRLGLETGELQKAQTRLTRSEQSRVKLPSKEDAIRFFMEGLISATALFDVLQRLGYSNAWATIYVQLAMKELSGAQKPTGA
jgi:hypothetical protein